MANQRSKKRDYLVGAYVTPELKQQIKDAAKREGITMADYIRKAVYEHTTTNEGIFKK